MVKQTRQREQHLGDWQSEKQRKYITEIAQAKNPTGSGHRKGTVNIKFHRRNSTKRKKERGDTKRLSILDVSCRHTVKSQFDDFPNSSDLILNLNNKKLQFSLKNNNDFFYFWSPCVYSQHLNNANFLTENVLNLLFKEKYVLCQSTSMFPTKNFKTSVYGF